MNKVLSVLVLTLIPTWLWATAPVVFFSDLTDGPISGFNQSATQGAAVTIWGLNFGASGTISCGGQTLSSSNSAQVAEWAATTYPTTARGLQRITFYLNSSMTTGSTTISVTTSGGTSGTISFYTRNTGNIYFLDGTNGDDSHSGLYKNHGSGTNGAWLTPSKVRATLAAGDVCYIRTGEFTTDDTSAVGYNFAGIMSFSSYGAFNNGTANNSITVTAYPGEDVKFTRAYEAAHYQVCIGTPAEGGGTPWSYWNFSKITMVGAYAAIANYPQTGSAYSYLRFVGLDIRTVKPANADTQSGCGIVVQAGPGGNTHFSLLGNYVHDVGVDYRGETPWDSERIYCVYIGGFGTLDYITVAYNEFCWNSAGRGFQIFGHAATDTLDHCYIYGNYLHDILASATNTGHGWVLGNGQSGTYAFVQNLYFYNNITAYLGTTAFAISQGGADYTGNRGGTWYTYNNIFLNTDASARSAINGPVNSLQTCYFKNNIVITGASQTSHWNFWAGSDSATVTADHNLYYGIASWTPPSWETGLLLNTDPKFTDATPETLAEYLPQSSAPTKNVGIPITYGAPNDLYDFNGVLRGASWDIGAFEYEADTTAPASAIKLYLTNTSSQGATQTNPNASLGGYRSTTQLSSTSMKNLFDDVTVAEAVVGDVEYRMIDVYNTGSVDMKKVQIFMKTPTSSTSTELAFGYSATAQPHADSWNGEALATESAAPASPAFSFANRTRGSPLSLGTIPAGQSVRVGVRRTVSALSSWTTSDLGVIGTRWLGE